MFENLDNLDDTIKHKFAVLFFGHDDYCFHIARKETTQKDVFLKMNEKVITFGLQIKFVEIYILQKSFSLNPYLHAEN